MLTTKFHWPKNINLLYNNLLRCHKNVHYLWYLNCTISFESYMVVIKVGNKKTAINNKARAIEQIFVLDPVKQNIAKTILR